MSNGIGLHIFDAGKQTRLDTLLTKNSAGKLTSAEKDELQSLARETEELTLTNASLLAAAVSEERVYTPEEALKLEAEAQERAFARRQELLQGSLTAPQVARRLGTTPQTPHDRAQSQTLLAIEDRGSLRFPYWQFDANGPNGVIAGLPDVLKALDASPLGKISWLTLSNPYLEGRTPLEALKAGETARVVGQARAVGMGI